MSQTDTPPPPSAKPGILRSMYLHTWRGRFAWLGGLILLTVIICWVMARATPSWYQPSDPLDLNVIDDAERAQIKIRHELHNSIQRVPNGEQRWSITQDEVNAFLAIFIRPTHVADPAIPDAAPSTPPPPISRPFVRFTPGEVLVAARSPKIPASTPEGGVGTFIFSVGIIEGPNGKKMGQIKLTGIRVGYLPVPGFVVEKKIRALLPEIISTAQEATLGGLGGNREGIAINDDVGKIIRDIAEGKPFELEQRINKRYLIIKELRVDEGQFTFVIAPAVPPVEPAPVPVPTPATAPTRLPINPVPTTTRPPIAPIPAPAPTPTTVPIQPPTNPIPAPTPATAPARPPINLIPLPPPTPAPIPIRTP